MDVVRCGDLVVEVVILDVADVFVERVGRLELLASSLGEFGQVTRVESDAHSAVAEVLECERDCEEVRDAREQGVVGIDQAQGAIAVCEGVGDEGCQFTHMGRFCVGHLAVPEQHTADEVFLLSGDLVEEHAPLDVFESLEGRDPGMCVGTQHLDVEELPGQHGAG